MSTLKGWGFPIDIDPSTGRIITKEDNEIIKQNVKIILETQRGERQLRPYFGTDTNQFMFAAIDANLSSQLSSEIRNSISMWEEHIEDLDVDAWQSPKNNALMKVDISYSTDLSPEKIEVSQVINRNDLN